MVRFGKIAAIAGLASFSQLAMGEKGEKTCLCVFDVDRTLTGKQGEVSQCPDNKLYKGVGDSAYGGGDLTLSQLAQHVADTFCAKCKIGSISAGDASGDESEERKLLHEKMNAAGGLYSDYFQGGCTPVKSPLVTWCPDGKKQTAMPGIVDWYRAKGFDIADEDVYFYDDREVNVVSFGGTKYNAHQISCTKRDMGGAIGLCGGMTSEIVKEQGQKTCKMKIGGEEDQYV